MSGRALSEPAPGRGGHGKLPGAGDFVSFGLAPRLRRAWDGWLSELPAASRAGAVDDAVGVERWAVAPRWALAAAPGVVGASALVAVVAASRDRVGRAFPFSLVAEGDDGSALDLLDDTPPPWFAAAGELVRAAVAGELTPADLPAALADLAPPAAAAATVTPVHAQAAARLRKVASAPRGVVMRPLDGSFSQAALWAPTLPSGALAAALIDGDFADRGWRLAP